MAGDFNKPVVTDNYTNVLAYIRDLFADVAKGLDATGSTNVPTNAIRWNSTNKFWEKYNGSWAALETKYMINVDTLDGYHANATATAGQIPVRDGSGKVDNVNFTGVSGTLGATNGGTGINSFTLGDLIYSSASNTLTKLAGNTTTAKQYLTQTGTGTVSAAPQWSALADADVPSTLTNKTFSTGCSWSGNAIAVGQGGTGITSYTAGDLIYASGAAALAKLTAVAAGSILASNGAGAAPVWTNTPNITGITTFSAANANGKYAVHISNASPYVSLWDTSASRKWLMGADEDQWWVYRAATQSETATDWAPKFRIDASGNIYVGNSVGAVTCGHLTCYSINTQGNHITANNITATGNLIVSNTANYVQFTDTNWGTRYIHHNDGNLGFLNSGGGWAAYTDNSGNFTAAGNITAYSDRRLKTDLQRIENALDKIDSLTGYTYFRIDIKERQAGLVTQEVQPILPEAVADGADGFQTLSHGGVLGLLVEGIKELRVEINQIKARLQ
jgi:hypothetical protein